MSDLSSFIFSPWGWLSAALVLGALEILIPGAYMIWLAAAALATAATVALTDGGVGFQLAVFAGWAVAALAGSRRLKRDHPIRSDDPALNDRTQRLLGATAIIVQPMTGGRGRVQLGNSEWLAEGPDLPVGTRVRVLGSDGTVLKIGPLAGSARPEPDADDPPAGVGG